MILLFAQWLNQSARKFKRNESSQISRRFIILIPHNFASRFVLFCLNHFISFMQSFHISHVYLLWKPKPISENVVRNVNALGLANQLFTFYIVSQQRYTLHTLIIITAFNNITICWEYNEGEEKKNRIWVTECLCWFAYFRKKKLYAFVIV